MRRHRINLIVIGCGPVLAVGAVIFLILASVVTPLDTPILGELRYSCAVGVVGTAASVTVRGILAGRQCRAWLRDSHGQFGQFFELTHTPTQSVICEYSHAHLNYTVRDSGILKIVGNGICQSIRLRLTVPHGSFDLRRTGIHEARSSA